ncbi:integrase core domain-containing protein [Aestuariibius sp. 2305UL40-4]|uniref:integrase core domain-containing protein n=1 Tax=Aestuariibius violaceus TaxID=3234132 RepID=UPI00398F7BA6
MVVDTSLSGLRVTRELMAIMARRGKPRTVVSDNGTGLTSMAVFRWCKETRIDWLHRAVQANAERIRRVVQRQFPGELLKETLFSSLADAREKITAWKEDYNRH